jgi:hypothetical protein
VSVQETRELVLAQVSDLRVLAEGLRVMQVRQGQVEEWVLRLERELVQVLEQVSFRQVRDQQALVLAEEQVEVLEPGQV